MVRAAQVVTPGSERVIRGEGMPISKAPGQKGNLRLQMDVQARALLRALRCSLLAWRLRQAVFCTESACTQLEQTL